MSTAALVPIAVTTGDPAGIGADILLRYLHAGIQWPLQVYSNIAHLERRARLLGIWTKSLLHHPDLSLVDHPLPSEETPGQLNTDHAAYVAHTLEQAVADCLAKRCRAMVTLPVHKGCMRQAGLPFQGHTEWLAQMTNTHHTVMCLVSDEMRVALATTHLPLAQVSAAINQHSLTRCIEIIDHELQTLFHQVSPRIWVCGLNPHCGEDGTLGQEEQQVIIPVIETMQRQGYQLSGPYSADTVFARARGQADVVLAMYHDQGLPAIKAMSFGRLVNITLGLPIIRTSVDHGVGLDIVGSQDVRIDSFLLALSQAHQLSLTRARC